MLRRFGISLEDDLLSQFDSLCRKQGYTNRSEAIRDLIRKALIKKEWLEGKTETTGVVMIVYDHHQYQMAQKMTDKQHEHYTSIIASLHSHLDHHNCVEIILLRGKAKEIQHISDEIISTKGVKYGQFIPATTGKTI
ncbi:MAG: nickel-responsive transcriptional regulator NikR [Spirochaetales bacterium]|nr:nickel-responsive transcriptional regulator NikR [Spirochaetales bacterium]